MFDWIKLFPPYLIFLTLILVIIPTILAIFLRVFLYRYLIDAANKVRRLVTFNSSRGVQPKIVTILEDRFKQASLVLEKVNTEALVDGVYSQEKFNFFGNSLSCEKWDYFCRLLPNLLLAFGLLGTFLGITINLYNLSETISQVGGEADNFIDKFQVPLQSMGIAFITSLIALVCSSLLTLVNLRCNTTSAKYALISSLEDYLDNILQPTIEGKTRLDQAINRMVDQQNEFLTRFHENVTQAVRSSLGSVAQQIAEGNKEATNLAKQVYERFTETAGTLNRGSETFYQSALLLEKQVNSLKEIVQHENFVKYAKTLENSAMCFLEASEMINNSQLSYKLVSATENLDKTQQQFSNTISTVTELIKTVEITIVNLNDSVHEILNFGGKIDGVNQQSRELISLNKEYLETGSLSLQTLGDRIIKSLDSQTNNNNQSNQVLLEKIELTRDYLYTIKSNFVQLINQPTINQEHLITLGDRLSKNMIQENGRTNYHVQIITEKVEKSALSLKEIESVLNKLTVTLNSKSNQSFLDNLSNFNQKNNL
ncbi:methyl-accepting chemotaxis protein [Crocosphaera sp. UHCC 0190]|uniref:methyl-accepting chemotaxis protein n=1 Tax=Crocosphaera sp. UHCC 0190 TaxID=3110246 RepID=UPI002B1EBD2E|nr:methyl-accepting chemotaxis protein [Crocosphaera sp. UHCC 0190]MEA5510886.1 methyl-accepting chemotaxis protein [Crocosphaera sp. UHCC 0190]